MKTLISYTPEDTIETAAILAKDILPGSFIALKGDLGAGKTVFVKGLAKGLEVKDHLYVNSPTFVILHTYQGKMPLYHFDVYRIDERALEETLDYKRYFYGDGICVVEWSNKIEGLLPDIRTEVLLEHEGESVRKITITEIR
ncbi:MAG: tRNA (adenosine(37)-N6)-threonylcarbamoyltransferase complex ATPase subunit type 1 TsaE [Candidatus Omnitrophica bacterium]|nr:tRNA (adenosine(37)-N6)-threonylcarbamoyltransferase complex ATPase subunit type 1 TsaE [Candidatus Omnitrophota bacterium]